MVKIMAKKRAKELDREEYISAIRDGVTLIDFFAEWSAPCRKQRTILKKVAEKYQGKAYVIDLNVDDYPDPALAFGITSIPTLIIFKEGNEFRRMFGMQNAEAVEQTLNEALTD